jgi:hypothetical protein
LRRDGEEEKGGRSRSRGRKYETEGGRTGEEPGKKKAHIRVTVRKAERKRRKQEASRRGRHHHQLFLLQNQEPDRARRARRGNVPQAEN